MCDICTASSQRRRRELRRLCRDTARCEAASGLVVARMNLSSLLLLCLDGNQASGAATPPSTDDVRILDAKRHLGCVFHLRTPGVSTMIGFSKKI